MKQTTKYDPQEFDLPETLFVRDLEDRVFQGIVLQVLSNTEDITLMGSSFIDSFLGRERQEKTRGIHIEQDGKKQCVSVKIEINVRYGVSIPEKAEEIQANVSKAITRLTGLHVSSVHVIFKNIVTEDQIKKIQVLLPEEKDVSDNEPA